MKSIALITDPRILESAISSHSCTVLAFLVTPFLLGIATFPAFPFFGFFFYLVGDYKVGFMYPGTFVPSLLSKTSFSPDALFFSSMALWRSSLPMTPSSFLFLLASSIFTSLNFSESFSLSMSLLSISASF